MRRIGLVFLTVIALLIFPDILLADEISDLKKEVEELKTRLEVVEAEGENVIDRIASFVTISGYADGEFILTDQAGQENEFRVHHLSLFFKKEISEKWRLFSELEYEDAPKIEDGSTTEGKFFVEVFIIEYLHSPLLNLRIGRYLTPAGIWNVEHYPPFVATQERPKHIRNIFPQYNDGLQMYGTKTMSDVVADYALYVANGSGNTGRGDDNEDKAIGGRVKFKIPLLAAFEVGTSAYREKDSSDLERESYGADLKIQWWRIKFQGEYAKALFDPSTGSDYERSGYYGQLGYDLDQWSFIYRYDWYEPNDIVSNDKTSTNTLAMNYHFTPYVTGKVEHHFIDPENPSTEEYNKTILSIAVYLGE